jgi:hypothetical protein
MSGFDQTTRVQLATGVREDGVLLCFDILPPHDEGAETWGFITGTLAFLQLGCPTRRHGYLSASVLVEPALSHMSASVKSNSERNPQIEEVPR